MAICRFCKRDVADDAIRCPHCTSFLNDQKNEPASAEVTYVLDRGLIRFLKYVVPLLGIFALIGVSFFFIDLKEAR
jgi:hypothetical protein